MTVALMGFIFLGANFVPSIWDAFQFTGATTAVSVGFIFPAAVALRDTHNISTRKDRLTSWMMILLAVSSSTVAISSDIYNFFHPDSIKVGLVSNYMEMRKEGYYQACTKMVEKELILLGATAVEDKLQRWLRRS